MVVSARAVEQKILIAVDFSMEGRVEMIDSTLSAQHSLGTTFSSVIWEQTSEVCSWPHPHDK